MARSRYRLEPSREKQSRPRSQLPRFLFLYLAVQQRKQQQAPPPDCMNSTAQLAVERLRVQSSSSLSSPMPGALSHVDDVPVGSSSELRRAMASPPREATQRAKSSSSLSRAGDPPPHQRKFEFLIHDAPGKNEFIAISAVAVACTWSGRMCVASR